MCSFPRKSRVSAAAAAADGHAGGDTNGWKHDSLDCPFTGCLFTRCLFTGCLRTACLFTDCLFTDCLFAGCLFPRCLFTGCLFPDCLFIVCRVACSPIVCVHDGCLLHRFWTTDVRKRTLADIEFRECGARQEKCSDQPRVMCSLSREGADSAAVVAADGRAGGDADGREHDNLKCPPSNSTIWSTDCEIRR